MKRIFTALLVLTTALTISCQKAPTRLVTDAVNRRVEVPVAVNRIIAVGPGSLQMVVYLGASDLVTGIDDYDRMSTSAQQFNHILNAGRVTVLPKRAPLILALPEAKTMKDLTADIIITGFQTPEEADKLQKTLKTPVLVVKYGPVYGALGKELFSSLRMLGEVLNKGEKAEKFITTYKETVSDIKKRIGPHNRCPSIYASAGKCINLTYNLNKEPYFFKVNLLGYEENLKATDIKSIMITKKKLATMKPDLVQVDCFGCTDMAKECRKKFSYFQKDLKKAEKNFIIVYPFCFYTMNLEAALVNAYTIGKIKYPDSFRNLELSRKGREIYTAFNVGRVYDVLVKEYEALGKELAIKCVECFDSNLW